MIDAFHPRSERCVATIVTRNFLFKALALRNSMVRFGALDFHILLASGGDEAENCRVALCDQGIYLHDLFEVYSPSEIEALTGRYEPESDALRWSSKSAFLRFLLEDLGYSGAIYADCDLYFVDDPGFLFELLKVHAVLLTPHWRPLLPEPDPVQYYCNFTDGLYNAGFIGASRSGIPALMWWHGRCCHRCEIDKAYGLYVDQKYLDLLPVHFDGVHVLKHPGCNVAEWNRAFLKRTTIDGRIHIDGRWPLVFIHFTHLTIEHIEAGDDSQLSTILAAYRDDLVSARHQVQRMFQPGGAS